MAEGIAGYVGREGSVEADGFKVRIKVEDARQAFGRLDLLVKATCAEGLKWVSSEKVKLD